MDRIYLAMVGAVGCGLTNQLYSLVNSLVIAHTEHKRFVILNEFNQNYNSSSCCPVSDIIDMDHLNKQIESLGLTVFDKNYVTMNITSVKYGTYFEVIDISSEINEKFIRDGKLVIRKGTNFNDIGGDPTPGKHKKLFIRYFINEISDEVTYDEYISQDIIFDLSRLPQGDMFNSINKYNTPLFVNILQNLKFTPIFYDLSSNFVRNLGIESVNVIHLRNEEDALPFWGTINNMPAFEFKRVLNDKYISLIQRYFNKDIPILILTGNIQNDVIKFLIDNDYKFYVSDKTLILNAGSPRLINGRETNAIIDLLIGEHCNSVFIGCVNPENFHGSTFSYMLWKRMNPHVRKVLIDLDEIKRNEFVVY